MINKDVYEVWNNWELQIRWMRILVLASFVGMSCFCLVGMRFWKQRVLVVTTGLDGQITSSVGAISERGAREKEVMSFTQEFLRVYLAPDSSMVESNFKRATAMMSAKLREQHVKFSLQSNYVKKVQGMRVSTDLSFKNMLVEKTTEGLIDVFASGEQRTLKDSGSAVFHPFKSLVRVRNVSRSQDNPYGLEVIYLDYEIKSI